MIIDGDDDDEFRDGIKGKTDQKQWVGMERRDE
jgi:hypothetical protein